MTPPLTPAEIAASIRPHKLTADNGAVMIHASKLRAAADLIDRLSAEHDRRVAELLAANNAEVERRRVAEHQRDAALEVATSGAFWARRATAAEARVAELESERGRLALRLAVSEKPVYSRRLLEARERAMREALESAKEWLDGWASAEPYLAAIDAALSPATKLAAPDAPPLTGYAPYTPISARSYSMAPAAPDAGEAVGWRGLVERMDAESVAMEASFAEARAAGLLPKEDGNG